MKVQLIVVQGKPEGKTIPLAGPTFRIGRGETCHLRPNSDQVSREHAEFSVNDGKVAVADLGSRNGTLVNGKVIKAITGLKNGDLVQVGPLTFAVSIQGAAIPASSPAGKPAGGRSLDDASVDDIDSWLVSDKDSPTPESPSGVYGGETITIAAFKEGTKPPAPKPPAPKPAAKPPVEVVDEVEPDPIEDEDEAGDEDEDSDDEGSSEDTTEEFVDESNPFYVKKKAPEAPAAGPSGKQTFRDTSDAATEILRKMMERRKQK